MCAVCLLGSLPHPCLCRLLLPVFPSWHGLFSAVVVMEDGPPKPDAAPVLTALRRMKVPADTFSSVAFLGDTVDDMVAARAAGVVPFGVLTPGLCFVSCGAGCGVDCGAPSHRDVCGLLFLSQELSWTLTPACPSSTR